jgi:hypothetical protein
VEVSLSENSSSIILTLQVVIVCQKPREVCSPAPEHLHRIAPIDGFELTASTACRISTAHCSDFMHDSALSFDRSFANIYKAVAGALYRLNFLDCNRRPTLCGGLRGSAVMLNQQKAGKW